MQSNEKKVEREMGAVVAGSEGLFGTARPHNNNSRAGECRSERRESSPFKAFAST